MAASTSVSNTSTASSRTSTILVELGFTDLSDGISLYIPPDSSSNHTSTRNAGGSSEADPTLLILCSWAFAQPRHIAKYLRPYQKLFPHTSILLIQNVIRNSIYVPDAWQYSFFQPAASALQSHLSTIPSPRILMHIFSNGGAHAAIQLSETCRETCGGLRMPIDALILDSCPGVPRFRPTINAMVQGTGSSNPLLRGTAAVWACAMVSTTALFDILNIMEPAGRKLYRKLYDPYDAFVFKGSPRFEKDRRPIPRTYLYSENDDMILAEDILANADMVERRMQTNGVPIEEVKSLVRLEEFIGTAHVNHVKDDPDRYWQVVKDTWERRCRP